MACYAGFGVCSGCCCSPRWRDREPFYPIYAVVVLLGVVRVVQQPRRAARCLPQIIPEEHLQNAIAWNSSVNQGATILGPSLGGLIYAVAKGPAAVYTTSMLAAVGAVFLMSQIKLRSKPRPERAAQPEIRAGGAPLYRQEEDHPGLHFAGPFRGAARRSGGAACRSSRAKFFGPGPGAWACCGRLPRSARAAWRCCWRTGPSAAAPA